MSVTSSDSASNVSVCDSPARNPSTQLCSRSASSTNSVLPAKTILEAHIDPALPLGDLHRREAHVRSARVTPSADDVFGTVPRADDVHFGAVVDHAVRHPVCVDVLAHLRHDLALTNRATLMRAQIEIGMKPTVDAEDADRLIPYIDNQPTQLAHITGFPDRDQFPRGASDGGLLYGHRNPFVVHRRPTRSDQIPGRRGK